MTVTDAAGASAPRSIAPDAALDVLRGWIARAVPAEATAWLDGEIARQRDGLDERKLGMALGLAGRKVGRRDLALTVEDIAAAQRARVGWQPQFWGSDEVARVALLLATYRGDDQAFAARIDKLCKTAEISEHVSYLKGFAIFPAPTALEGRAREGVRSSSGAVFEAIACRNPYPADYFSEAAWNQMVVKCVFVGAPIGSLVGLRERRNPELLQMLRDFVAERHAAGRPLPDEVHRFIDA